MPSGALFLSCCLLYHLYYFLFIFTVFLHTVTGSLTLTLHKQRKRQGKAFPKWSYLYKKKGRSQAHILLCLFARNGSHTDTQRNHWWRRAECLWLDEINHNSTPRARVILIFPWNRGIYFCYSLFCEPEKIGELYLLQLVQERIIFCGSHIWKEMQKFLTKS